MPTATSPHLHRTDTTESWKTEADFACSSLAVTVWERSAPWPFTGGCLVAVGHTDFHGFGLLVGVRH
jgi:hypothetical protein